MRVRLLQEEIRKDISAGRAGQEEGVRYWDAERDHEENARDTESPKSSSF